MGISVTGYFVSADKSLIDFDFVHRYISVESYWAKNIPAQTMRTAIENSLAFGVYTEQRKQVGFARVITDYATFGYLADVFIDPEHRGKGLSKFLMSEIMSHSALGGLRRMALFTRDAHKLYEQFGWGPGKTPDLYMEIKKENPYGSQ